ncbi:MAG: hypothetical protein RMJ36_05470 [Candidatus Calescibacterium sp.]|nr:hypothetical protein [Candidatus Calescibacterium sp.]MDW8133085.1 hypothetical protein [Candidatus Calescibacterium sp.]
MIVIEIFKRITRRTIFLVVAIFLILGTIFSDVYWVKKINLEVLRKTITPASKQAYDFIESIPSNSVVLVSGDYGPSTRVEADPILENFLKQCFRRDIKVIAISLWPDGAQIVATKTRQIANQYNKIENQDYVIGGYVVGGAVAIEKMGVDLKDAIPLIANNPAPFLRDIKTAHDLSLVFSIAAGDTLVYYIRILKSRYGVNVSGGCTAVMAAEMYPYILSGQLIGLFGGLKGAADYEILESNPEPDKVSEAVKYMLTQSLIHALLIIFIIIANIVYIYDRLKFRRK